MSTLHSCSICAEERYGIDGNFPCLDLTRTAIARLNPKACSFNECTLHFHKFFSVSLTLDLLRWSRDQSTTIPSGYTSVASAVLALILELTAMPTRPHILPHPHQIPTRNLSAFTLGGIPVMNLRNKCVQLSLWCALARFGTS